MLYERTAVSRKPDELIEQDITALRDEDRLTPDMVFRDPYILDFLGLTDSHVERDGEDAIIELLDSNVATTHLKLGPDVQRMSDQEILDSFNLVIAAQQQRAAENDYIAVEVPPGSPQIEYFEPGDQWTPRGAVLRCLISDMDGRAVITIDGRELSIEEFGRLLTTYSGWGMRIVFVHESEIEEEPRIEVREPDLNGR